MRRSTFDFCLGGQRSSLDRRWELQSVNKNNRSLLEKTDFFAVTTVADLKLAAQASGAAQVHIVPGIISLTSGIAVELVATIIVQMLAVGVSTVRNKQSVTSGGRNII